MIPGTSSTIAIAVTVGRSRGTFIQSCSPGCSQIGGETRGYIREPGEFEDLWLLGPCEQVEVAAFWCMLLAKQYPATISVPFSTSRPISNVTPHALNSSRRELYVLRRHLIGH